MSAPERIFIAGRHDVCGQYYEEAVEAEGEHGGTAVPYIRLDAPELLAMVDALRALEDDGNCNNAWDWFEARLEMAAAAITAWEKLTK